MVYASRIFATILEKLHVFALRFACRWICNIQYDFNVLLHFTILYASLDWYFSIVWQYSFLWDYKQTLRRLCSVTLLWGFLAGSSILDPITVLYSLPAIFYNPPLNGSLQFLCDRDIFLSIFCERDPVFISMCLILNWQKKDFMPHSGLMI